MVMRDSNPSTSSPAASYTSHTSSNETLTVPRRQRPRRRWCPCHSPPSPYSLSVASNASGWHHINVPARPFVRSVSHGRAFQIRQESPPEPSTGHQHIVLDTEKPKREGSRYLCRWSLLPMLRLLAPASNGGCSGAGAV